MHYMGAARREGDPAKKPLYRMRLLDENDNGAEISFLPAVFKKLGKGTIESFLKKEYETLKRTQGI